jgi:phosphatidylserine/phosphatidylglycerophosphate/cardiolipin synthase-like enzyme
MITVTGRVVDERGTPMGGVQVIALGDWLLTTEKLAKPVTVDSTDGRFNLEVEGVKDVEGGTSVPSSFRVRFVDSIGRQLRDDKELAGTVPSHDLQDVKIHLADRDGLLVTNLTGTAKFVSDGNAVKLLVDGVEAFGRVADEIKLAQHSINLTQLFFAVPDEFQQDNEAIDPATKEPKEKAKLVFKFLGPPLTPIDPHISPSKDPAPRIGDDRPERLLVNKAVQDKTIVRILLNDPTLGWPEGIFWLAVLTPVAAGLGVGGIAALAGFVGIGIAFLPVVLVVTVLAYFVEFVKVKLKLEETTDVDDTKKYFGQAIANETIQRITVHGFRQTAPDHGVLHCKMLITDEKRAVVLGSPFSQRYFDSVNHVIEDPHRGSNTSDMVHDLSIAVVGPAVHHLYETFLQYWNEDLPEGQQLPKLPDGIDRNTQTSGEDAVSKVQVVRTLGSKRFTKLGKNEKGILEGYLRAFAAAKHYIYLENQYFTDSIITDALVEALNTKPNLELILVVPIKPDVPFYPRRQAWRIEQLRKAGGDRVGVFTRWTYDASKARPWIAPVYIHAKGAIVDDSWATIGSANLDGLSLDYNLLLSPLVFGETTATELNLNVLPPSPGAVTPFGGLMRRRLFAEHLGIVANGIPNPNDSALAPGPEHKWLKQLWRPTAERALSHVKAAKREALPGFVLEYPKKDGGSLDTPRKHLAALGVHLKLSEAVVRPITGTRKFHFSSGKWDIIPEREDIRL